MHVIVCVCVENSICGEESTQQIFRRIKGCELGVTRVWRIWLALRGLQCHCIVPIFRIEGVVVLAYKWEPCRMIYHFSYPGWLDWVVIDVVIPALQAFFGCHPLVVSLVQ